MPEAESRTGNDNLDGVPSVSECLNRIVSEITGRRPLNARPVGWPNEYRGIIPIVILNKGHGWHYIPAPFIVPLGGENLQHNILKIPGANIIAKAVDGLFFGFPGDGLPEATVRTRNHLATGHPNLNSIRNPKRKSKLGALSRREKERSP